jgi:uncharacterized protein (TIGR02452 family)
MMIAMHLSLIAQPWKTTTITAPAPNHGAIIMNYPSHEIEETFKRRIDMILSIAVHFGRRHLVLGAWGCSAFRNDPKDVAPLFRDRLQQTAFRGAFDTITIVVLEMTNEKHNLTSFKEVFAVE